MSLPINPPNPNQPTLSFSSVITPETLDTYTTSNYVSNISNILDTKINTKQNTLTAATNLLGIGSSITNIEYGNVINKPTNFPTDWNTTVSNKPSTFPPTMTNLYNRTEIDNISNANSNYTSTTSNILSNLINTNANNNSNYTSTTSNILSNLINTNANNPNYLLKSGGTMTGAINGATRIGIGITNPDNILQIVDGGRLRISNSNIDFTILGTKDNFNDINNTRIVLSGSARSTQAGNIEYVGVNNHIFYTTSSGSYDERMRILSTGRIGISTSSPLTRFTIRSSYSDEITGFCIDAYDGSVYNLRLFPYVIAGGRVGYIFKVNNQASSTNALLLGDNGSVGVGSLDTAFKLNVNGNIKTTDLILYNSTTSTYQLLVSGPSSTGPATIQTIQQGVGYNQNIVFQNLGGNVGIGTLTNITEKLFVNGNIKATNLIASTRITAEGDVRSPAITLYNSAASSYEISMGPPSATGPASIQTIQQGVGFNQSLTIQAAGNGTVSIGTTSVGTYKLNVNGSLNATTLWQNGTELNTLLNNKQNTISTYTITGATEGSLSFATGTLTLAMPTTYTSLSIASLTSATSILYQGTEVSTLLNSKQNTLTASTTLSGIGSNLTLVNYNTLSNLPDLTLYNGWTKSGNDIYNTSLASGKVGIGITNPTSVLELLNFDTYKLKFGHTGRWAVNQIFCSWFFRFLTSYTGTNEIAYFGYVDSYDDPINRTMVLGITRTALNMTGDIYATENVGFGIAPSATYKLNVNGSINSTSLWQNGTQIDFSSYATNTNLTNNYYTKTTTDTLLSAKQNTLTAATTLLGIGSAITLINYNTLSNLPSTFPPIMTNIYSKTESDARYIQITGGDITSGTLNFGSRTQDYIINLWGTNSYGFGINSSMLRYNSSGNHTFYCAGTQRAQINSTGLSVSGEITNQYWRFTNESDYLRLYTASGNTYFRFAARTLWCAEDLQVGTTASISGILTLNNSLKFKTNVWNTSTDNKNRIYFADNNTTYFQGYAPTTVENAFVFRNSAGTDIFTINDNGNAYFLNKVSARFLTVANTNRDLLGIQFEATNVGDNNNGTIYCINDTFTGFHRCFTEDELFDITDPQLFKDTYEGRIVVSTGKIATDTTYDINNPDNTEWTTLYDKDGITIEDALFMVELSRKKKDKRVIGVLGAAKRTNSRPNRLIINSVGEGSVWIINSNGNFENGDLITTSDYLGYGENQQTEFITNYTCGKITMDCDFQLNSHLYNCFEIEDIGLDGNRLRVAFVACVYYAG